MHGNGGLSYTDTLPKSFVELLKRRWWRTNRGVELLRVHGDLIGRATTTSLS